MNKNVFLIKEEGLTLLELLLVITIISIVILGLNSIFVSGYKSYTLGNERAEIQRSIRLIDKIVNNHLRYAESIKIKNISKPAGESTYEEVLELESNVDGKLRLKHNNRVITDYIIKDIKNINITSSRVKFALKFVDGTEMTINALLNNM
ncbi:MAG: prepilin-type N-terminal cleavage/methylation domain-containing protein [Halanaerobiales bacterium]|nr:prepilin-type N-terminal cleavage/methylation domain-containing protein [Halanaerobiales bacterium]